MILLQGFIEYLTESALHGLKYLTGGGRVSKIFWVGQSYKFIPFSNTLQRFCGKVR